MVVQNIANDSPWERFLGVNLPGILMQKIHTTTAMVVLPLRKCNLIYQRENGGTLYAVQPVVLSLGTQPRG